MVLIRLIQTAQTCSLQPPFDEVRPKHTRNGGPVRDDPTEIPVGASQRRGRH